MKVIKFVGADPNKEDLSSAYNLVGFFLRSNLKYPTSYGVNKSIFQAGIGLLANWLITVPSIIFQKEK